MCLSVYGLSVCFWFSISLYLGLGQPRWPFSILENSVKAGPQRYPLQPSRVPTDLKNHCKRGFDEMASIVTGSFLELLLAVHGASTDCIDVSMRVGLRTILPLGTEIALTLVA